MPLQLPNLDNRTFTDLSVELRSLIQRYDKEWTNHNPSDPGITLIELFAWLAEMLIYRMNRVEQRSYLTFLEFIGIQPSGPQTVVTFEINIPKDALPVDFVLPRGTRVSARDERSGEGIVFETTVDASYSKQNWDEYRNVWVFKVPAVNNVLIENELLGFSSGAPRQEYSLKRGPLFLTREHESYDGNPKMIVESAGVPVRWFYRADLLSSGPDHQHFTAEPLTGLIRFGDGTNGKIPPRGAELTCTYACMGRSSGNIGAGKITTLVKPLDRVSTSSIVVFNEYPASGGKDEETLDDLLARGLASLQDPYRAVSDEDFENLALQAAPCKVARVKVMADKNLEGTTPDEEGHISVIIMPALKQLDLRQLPAEYDDGAKAFRLNRTTAAVRAALLAGHVKRLKREIFRYLDERRLITTVVHVVEPSFTTVRLKLVLEAKPGVNTEKLKKTVGGAIALFLDPYKGWQDQHGWPYGRKVYRSELYQLIEPIAGVDHVTTLTMNDDATKSFIEVDENGLVCLDELAVAVS